MTIGRSFNVMVGTKQSGGASALQAGTSANTGGTAPTSATPEPPATRARSSSRHPTSRNPGRLALGRARQARFKACEPSGRAP
jgi:hypothetical protein